ncbi:MAG: glycosyltransferase family 39 protein, partial [Cyanobacteria bacterium J06642_2]
MRAKSAIPNWLKLALGIAIAFGIMIRGVNLDSRVFWFDETITSLRIAGYTELELFEETLSDGPISSAELLQYQSVNADRGALDTVQALASADIHHPPLYYVLVRWWADWFGDGVGSVRSLSVVFGLLVLPCAYWVAWELTASPLAGWLAVAIVAVSPVQVIYSQEAREYSLWFLTTLLASGALLRALRHKTRLSWLGYAIAATLGLYSHLFFCLVMVSHGLYVVTQGGLKSRRLAIDYLAASGLAILSFVPWIVLVLRNLQKIQSSMDWVTESNSRAYLIQRWVANFSYLFFDFNANSSSSRLTLAVTGIGVLVTAAAVIYAAVWMLRFLPSRVGWFAITLSGVLAVLLVGSDILAGGFRSGIARYLIPCYLAIQLVLACVLAGWLGGMSGLKLANPSRSRRLAATLLCSLLLVGILSGANATQARTWWQKGSASADNLNLLPWLERAERPLVLVTVDRAIATGEMLALSHLLPPEAQLQWWDSQHPLPDSVREFDSVFVYGMTDESEPFGNAGEASFESLFQGKRRSLWQVQQRSSAQLPNIRGRNGYLWGNVAIGGGGYVTNVYLHPGQPDLVYIKTDVGGFYRWLGSERRWLPLTDWLSQSQHNLYGGEALALDPNDPERVYIAAGKFLNSGKGALYRSSDRGVTWTKLPLELPMGGNEDKRWIGERLAIDPSNSQVLLFGSRRDGLWRSADAGSSWQAIEFPGNLQTDIGISDVRFDPVAPQRVYATAYGDGIYQSDDSGLTWTHLPGSPTRAHRMAIAANPIPTLYVTHAAGVSRYRERAWKDITPRNPATPAFNAIAIDPFEPNRLIAVYDQYHDRANQQRVFVSEDSGENWQVQTAYGNSGAPWWEDAAFGAATAAIAFDPHVPDRVWLTDWSGVWQTSNINR